MSSEECEDRRMAKWVQLIVAREQKHLSQQEAVERVNVGLVTYQRWESGKTKPQPQHMRHLFEVFETLLQQQEALASQGEHLPALSSIPASEDTRDVIPVALSAEGVDRPQAFITAHMTTCLWSLAFLDHPTCYKKRSAIRKSIKEFDCMNTDNKNYQMTRREALCSLATLPMITLGLSSPGKTISSNQYGTVLAQCAASVEACWELRKSDNASDRLLAFQSATKYLPILKSIAQNSAQHRDSALDLATRYALIKAFLARHCLGLTEAIHYGKEAVALSKETGDIALILSAHSNAAWSFFFAKKSSLALAAIQEAEASLLEYLKLSRAQPVHPCVQGQMYSTLALMHAKNGLSPDVPLGKALEMNIENETYPFVDFKQSNLLLEAGWTYCYQGDQIKAMAWLGKRVNPETLEPRIRQSALGRVETMNVMTLSSLKAKDRDMEKTIHLWTAAVQEATTLQSEQRFHEALANYELMEVVWPGEQRITALRDYLVHWQEEN